jgi:MraZ protein
VSFFFGEYYTTMDDKGRFALPAKLRNVLGPDNKPLLDGTLVLTKGLEECLALYSESEWQAVRNRFSKISFARKDYRFFSRRFYRMACQVVPDRSGRILIPSTLIKVADLKKELLVMGQDRWIEIWNPLHYQKYDEEYSASYEDVAERLFTPDGDYQE